MFDARQWVVNRLGAPNDRWRHAPSSSSRDNTLPHGCKGGVLWRIGVRLRADSALKTGTSDACDETAQGRSFVSSPDRCK